MPNQFKYEDGIYKEHIKTVLFYIRGNSLSQPIINIRANHQLELTFDDLNGETSNYSYTLLHCNADWTAESDLSTFDYLDGFTDADIDDYRFAYNTKQDYTQYRLRIPNNRMNFTKTGNYLLIVYADNDPDDVVLTKRFSVFQEDFPIIQSSVLRPNVTRYITTHQRLSFTIDYQGFPRLSPMSDIQVNILQNGRWDNAILGLRPQFIRSTELVYDYNDQSLFKAGKEFRYFGFRDFSFSTERVRSITEEEDYRIVDVLPDETRHRGRYSFWKDMNGLFLIGRNGGYTRVDADYAYVQFTMLSDRVSQGDVYVYGALSNWKTDDDAFKMKYDAELGAYTADLYLKQGVYNYQYVIKEFESGAIDDNTLEGSYWETENDYYILIYYRPFNERYDRLAGFKVISSKD